MRINVVKKGQFLLLLSFLLLSACGTLLLRLPGMLKNGGILSWSDAAFMASSAVCINGLVVRPVTEFSFTGQAVLLVLIQLGCIGIMSLSAMILLMIGRGLSFSNTLMLCNLNDRFSLRGTEALTRTIIFYTLIAEAAGAVLMYPAFLYAGYPWSVSLWYALYYAVGSFCNAGIGPLENIASCGKAVQFISAVLIVFGGLGVYVIYDLRQFFFERRPRMRLHSRIVLWTTLILLTAGTLLLWILSRDGGVTLGWFDAFYLSASSRTAGYAPVEAGQLSSACRILLILLMLAGGSPGSTAGGIKTTTVAIAFAALCSSFKGDNRVMIGHRTIAFRDVLRSFTIIVIFLLLSLLGTMMLICLADAPQSAETLNCFFETVSALSTCGMGTGDATLHWNTECKWLLIAFMFTGRVGPLTIILFFVGREKPERLRYPEERVIVG